MKPIELFAKKSIDVDGKLVEAVFPDLTVWAAVNTETGEVDLGNISDTDDDLPRLMPQWCWLEFTLNHAARKSDHENCRSGI
jgi:hypothetical protein